MLDDLSMTTVVLAADGVLAVRDLFRAENTRSSGGRDMVDLGFCLEEVVVVVVLLPLVELLLLFRRRDREVDGVEFHASPPSFEATTAVVAVVGLSSSEGNGRGLRRSGFIPTGREVAFTEAAAARAIFSKSIMCLFPAPYTDPNVNEVKTKRYSCQRGGGGMKTLFKGFTGWY